MLSANERHLVLSHSLHWALPGPSDVGRKRIQAIRGEVGVNFAYREREQTCQQKIYFIYERFDPKVFIRVRQTAHQRQYALAAAFIKMNGKLWQLCKVIRVGSYDWLFINCDRLVTVRLGSVKPYQQSPLQQCPCSVAQMWPAWRSVCSQIDLWKSGCDSADLHLILFLSWKAANLRGGSRSSLSPTFCPSGFPGVPLIIVGTQNWSCQNDSELNF